VRSSLDRIDGRPVVLNVSGGKDSTAAGLHLKELGIPFTCLHLDTGWEHESTEAYVRDVLPGILGPIEIRGYPGGMEALILKKGMFPSRVRRFCTQLLKVKPAQSFFKELGEDVVNVVGIRHDESRARSKMPEWEEGSFFSGETWRPLIRWTLDDVIDIHKRHGIRPNPLYLRGASRVGCWPCIFARKGELRMLGEIDPERVAHLRALEARVGEAAEARARAKGTELKSAPTFFHAKIGRKGMWSIDRVMEWAQTARGGKQVELFAPADADAGCMRWGLCETHAESNGA